MSIILQDQKSFGKSQLNEKIIQTWIESIDDKTELVIAAYCLGSMSCKYISNLEIISEDFIQRAN